IVIGSGGAARSAIAALASMGVPRVVVRARAFADTHVREDFAAELQSRLAEIGAKTVLHVESFHSRDMRGAEASALAVVQATSAGMSGASPGEDVASAVAWAELPARAIAYDVVYAPPDTP